MGVKCHSSTVWMQLDRFDLSKDTVLEVLHFMHLFGKVWHQDQHAMQHFKAVAGSYCALNSFWEVWCLFDSLNQTVEKEGKKNHCGLIKNHRVTSVPGLTLLCKGKHSQKLLQLGQYHVEV